MSPFAHLLHELRLRHGVRQSELSELIGYDQTYISAVEVGLKGVPASDFIDRVSKALTLSDEETLALHEAAEASQRKFVIDIDAPQDAYWLLKELRDQFHSLSATQIRVLRDVLRMRVEGQVAAQDPVRRLRRRSARRPPCRRPKKSGTAFRSAPPVEASLDTSVSQRQYPEPLHRRQGFLPRHNSRESSVYDRARAYCRPLARQST